MEEGEGARSIPAPASERKRSTEDFVASLGGTASPLLELPSRCRLAPVLIGARMGFIRGVLAPFVPMADRGGEPDRGELLIGGVVAAANGGEPSLLMVEGVAMGYEA